MTSSAPAAAGPWLVGPGLAAASAAKGWASRAAPGAGSAEEAWMGGGCGAEIARGRGGPVARPGSLPAV